MYRVKSFIGFIISCIFIMPVFSGCAGTTTDISPVNGPAQSLRPGYKVVYYPKLQPGATLDFFQKELDSTGIDPRPAVFVSDDAPHYQQWHVLIHIFIYPDIIQLEKYNPVYNESQLFSNTTYSFQRGNLTLGHIDARLANPELLKSPIVVERGTGEGSYPYIIFFKDLIAFRFAEKDFADAQTVADALYFLQHEQKKKQAELDRKFILFQPIADRYHALKIKPAISEKQRKYIVQANEFTKQKQYKLAEEKYLKAIELDPASYPSAYFNMALLAAQENSFRIAIFRMKQYLLLVPDARDARDAQDKIYVWEGMMGE